MHYVSMKNKENIIFKFQMYQLISRAFIDNFLKLNYY